MTKPRPGGGYRATSGFQTATLIYDATYWFCDKFLDARSRTTDQMIQAARTARQHLAEAGRTSEPRHELRFLHLARAGLEALLLDYEDYLRHRRLALWPADSADAYAVRQVPRRFDPPQTPKAHPADPYRAPDFTALSDAERWTHYAPWLEHRDAAVRANAALCLIRQANEQLDRQIDALEKAPATDAGRGEPPAFARPADRQKKKGKPAPNAPDGPSPPCPKCAKPMVLRTAKSGKNAGRSFWGCTGYPECKGTAKA